MKTTILKTAILIGSLIFSANLFAFTAVTSGAWSNSATWGGVGPGGNVTGQDIIIPAGITVDMDVDVTFTGALNTFTVNGTLISTTNHDLWIGAGSFAGSGSSTMRHFTMNSALATYSSTGPLIVGTLSNQGATIPAASNITVGDSLDLSSGTIMLNSGCDLNMGMNSRICVDNGTIVPAGGVFTTAFPYSIWYVGGTKTLGLEYNSVTVQNIHVALSTNGDDLIINTDVTVNGTLDIVTGHVLINGNTLTLMGDYTGGAGAQFETNGSSLVIAGNAGTLSRELSFSATSTLSKLTINRNVLTAKLESALTVLDSIQLMDGTLRLMPGSTLTTGAGCQLEIMGGFLFVTGGAFDGTAGYDVTYSGNAYTAGPELEYSGLTNVTIDLFSVGQFVTMTEDVLITGALNMIKGKLNLDIYRLELQGTLNQQSMTAFMGSSLSIMHLHMTSSVNDTIWFDATAPAMNELIIELPALSTITLGSGVTIHGQLIFVSGKIDAGDADLSIRPFASIAGNDETKYVVTSGIGSLRYYLTVDASLVVFPVGTAGGYTPAAVRQVDSASSGYVKVRVMDGVYTSGNTGTDISTWASVVNKTWIIEPDTASVLDMTVRLFWMVTNEVNGFDRNNSYVASYANNMWDMDTASAAVAGPNNTYRSTREHLFTGGPFAVVDSSVPLGIEAPVAGVFSLYPNPTLDFVTVNTGDEQPNEYLYELLDASGKLVYSFSNHNMVNQIDLANYESGYYVLRITNLSNQVVETKHIVKANR